MYHAKSNGKSGYVIFNRAMNRDAVERLELESDLRQSVDNAEFCIHYQPIFDLATGQVCEVEALVRWDHPVRGFLPPAKFIPIAEETGLIVPLGSWVLRMACAQMMQWHEHHETAPPLIICVNLSGKQLQHPEIVADVRDALRETGLPPSCLKLEITESMMMADVKATVAKLQQLRDLGVHIAVDDFGTGYSSMAYLSSMPIDTLKIDRTFISRLEFGDEDEGIVRAILSLAKTLNLKVTSEGIEEPEQLSHLRALGCDQGQGYYFSRPLASDALSSLLTARHAGSAGTRETLRAVRAVPLQLAA
jgi:EAL domain-containing protein (putative c-di-GMP-specific phosphodiesterase class I)